MEIYSSLASFLACVKECISEGESRRFEVILKLYKLKAFKCTTLGVIVIM